ncbi:hypothetical protein POTOM_045872 [Populus tomentosa]|uniref:Uncharacterized protein n=1 Tax=Populus tomentosa TaxID=118781 RepID=A0A8X8CDL4_POPTO|nr:hypothetical protein POTOM_045872 [Populus tomentosa]
MATPDERVAPAKLEGKHAAVLVCWLLGIGCLVSWNSMLTIEDYYALHFPVGFSNIWEKRTWNLVGICALSGAFGLADAHGQGGMVGELCLMQPEFVQLSRIQNGMDQDLKHWWRNIRRGGGNPWVGFKAIERP